MGILIQFPQPGTRTPPGEPPSSHTAPPDAHQAAAYRRDLDRAVTLLLEHVRSDAYDGVALILKPTSLSRTPAYVVGGFYRHRLTDAADAAMQLRLAINLRAREQGSEPRSRDTSSSRWQREHSQLETIDRDMKAAMQEKWNDATTRYHRCERMLRIAFSQ